MIRADQSKSMTEAERHRAAFALNQYMAFRSAGERVDYALDSEFFKAALATGIRLFFGVEVDERGLLACDVQNPESFVAFVKSGDRRWITVEERATLAKRSKAELIRLLTTLDAESAIYGDAQGEWDWLEAWVGVMEDGRKGYRQMTKPELVDTVALRGPGSINSAQAAVRTFDETGEWPWQRDDWWGWES